ncbi:MAG: helix-turn-helix transcriptional regulator [Blastocatellia bacterium]|nr:helix-turn-helix transcriptional regulator [Blastocatellia bacterium]
MATVGDRIKKIRETKKMTQEQLANQAGISKGFLSDLENKNKNLSSQSLLKIANVLGASVDYLLSGETKEFFEDRPVVIPRELSKAAEELNLSYTKTLELLDAHRSVVAKRSTASQKVFTTDDWKGFYEMIKEVFG